MVSARAGGRRPPTTGSGRPGGGGLGRRARRRTTGAAAPRRRCRRRGSRSPGTLGERPAAERDRFPVRARGGGVRRRPGARRRRRASSGVAASTITRTSGSVPEGRSRIRPESPSLSCSRATASASSGSSVRSRSTPGTLTSTCGSRVTTEASSRSDDAGAGHPLQDLQRAQDAVAGGGVLAHDDVAGLLAAEGEPAVAHGLEHVAVADRGLVHGDAGPPHRLDEARGCSSPWPRRCRGRGGRARAGRAASIAISWSPSTVAPVWSIARHRSASPSRAKPASAPCSSTASRRPGEVGRAAALVDVEAVGLVVDRDHRGAGGAQRRGPDLGRRAVRAVEHDTQAGRAVVEGADEVVGVLLDGRGVRRDAADVGAGRAVPRPRRGAPRSRAPGRRRASRRRGPGT